METEINIVEILKDKPKGTKLYFSACGKCKLEEVDDKSFKISFYNSKFGFMNGGEGYLDKNGKLYDDGECVVFPSKEMRDWEKFAWKRGDVLVNSRGLKILFDRWENDNYTSFYAKTINLVEDGFLDTNLHTLASEKEAKSFIKCIEEKLGGKLNRETLEIEKTQPEFKDGDIVVSNSGSIVLVKEIKCGERVYYHACMINGKVYIKGTEDEYYGIVSDIDRLATDTEKLQFFEALAKKSKRWDIGKKQIVDLPKQPEFKPFDKVLVRNYDTDDWFPGFFEKFDSTWNNPYHIMNLRSLTDFAFKQCIPYNENTEHLLGTTDKWEGGVQ